MAIGSEEVKKVRSKKSQKAVYCLRPFVAHNGGTFSGLSLVAVSPLPNAIAHSSPVLRLPANFACSACRLSFFFLLLPVLLIQFDFIISFVPSIAVHYLPISAQSQKVEQ